MGALIEFREVKAESDLIVICKHRRIFEIKKSLCVVSET